MMARLLGLLSRERLASEMSAVTRVIVILHNDTETPSPVSRTSDKTSTL